MKARHFILFLLVVFVVSCTSKNEGDAVETGHGTSLPFVASPELVAIDTLMWQQPDSALAVLMDYMDDDGRDAARHVSTNETFDNHYAHLLLAELLYKNDYAQTNRTELQKAVDFFDNLTHTINDHPHASRRHCGLDPQSPKHNDNLIFLDARAHYINGVGYYERDSVVEACEEYLKALEVMEDCFEVKNLVGKKMLFMTYIYNRLGEMFSEQLMMEQTIECCRKLMDFYTIESASPYDRANVCCHIGIGYDVLGQKDSAYAYYNQALFALPDTNNSYYHDIISNLAFLDYQMNNNAEKPLREIHYLLEQAEDEDERLTRQMLLGTVYFMEQQFDSALPYLKTVYENKKKVAVQIQVAKYLLDIYQSMGNEDKVNEYAGFLSQHTVSSYEQKAVQSQLTNLYQDYQRKKAEARAQLEKTRQKQRYFIFPAPLVLLLVVVVIFIQRYRHKKKLKKAEECLIQEEIQHAAELDDLRGVNNRLQKENQKLIKLSQHSPQKAKEKEYDALMHEAICLDLMQRFDKTDILTTNKPEEYAALAITPKEKQSLAKAVMKHCPDFDSILKTYYPTIKANDLEVCRFFLIGLSETQIAVLLQKDYSTIWRRSRRLKEMMKYVEPKMHLTRLLFEMDATT